MSIHNIPEIEGVNAEEIRENSRRAIAFSITGAFVGFLLIATLFTVFSTTQEQFNNGMELIKVISTVFAGLVGSVLGFYFGSQKN